ncbi:MAG: hypothetical protein DRP92_03645, partial [Candidatus Neomarinimicrobiota bacterium]
MIPADDEISDRYWDPEWENRSYSKDPFPIVQGQDLNGGTVPNNDFRDGSESHYAFQNIVWDNNDKTVSLEVYTNAWAGEISENTTWEKDVFIYDDITIDMDVTLTIGSGVKVEFASGKKMTVNGRLVVQGTSTEPITLTSSSSNPSPGSWYGIVVEDGGEIELNHARVEYATYGVKSSYADVELRNSEFMRNKWGCRLYHSDGAVIDNCVFSDNYYYGALLSYSS